MFSANNMMELLKALTKTAILFVLAYLVGTHFLAQLFLLPENSTANVVLAISIAFLDTDYFYVFDVVGFSVSTFRLCQTDANEL